MLLVSSADFFFKITFFKKKIRNIFRVSNCLDPDILSVLIWVQTVCKSDQQKLPLAGEELIFVAVWENLYLAVK